MKIKKLKQQLSKAEHAIDKSDTLLVKMKEELKQRAIELGEKDGFLEESLFVSDRRLMGCQARIDKEIKRNERLRLATIPIQRKLAEAKSQNKDEAITLKDTLLENIRTKRKDKLAVYREKEAELKELQLEVGELYNEQVAMERDFHKLDSYLTDDKVGDLIDNTDITISRDGELRRLFKTYPEIAEILSSDISEAIKQHEKRVKDETKKAKECRQAEVDKRKSLLKIAKQWLDGGYYPYELHSSSHLLNVDLLSSYWRNSGIDPVRDYDKNRVLIKAVA